VSFVPSVSLSDHCHCTLPIFLYPAFFFFYTELRPITHTATSKVS